MKLQRELKEGSDEAKLKRRKKRFKDKPGVHGLSSDVKGIFAKPFGENGIKRKKNKQ